jgi:hypothetical protein
VSAERGGRLEGVTEHDWRRVEMSGAGGKRVVVAVVVGLLLGFGGLVQPAAQARRENNGAAADRGGDLYGCDRTIGQPPQGHLVKRTTPPAGAAVQPGDTIDVDLVWAKGDWSASRLHKVLDCVAIDGRLVRSLQAGESPTDNDGRFHRSYTVPADVPTGARICDQAMLSGPSPRGDYDRQVSNMVCHTVAGNGAADRPPCADRCGGRGCSDCYDKPPSSKGGGGERGCSDCYESPPARDRCGDQTPCSAGSDRCGDSRGVCEGRDRRDRDGGDCRCDRDHDGSFLHRLLRHIFTSHAD